MRDGASPVVEVLLAQPPQLDVVGCDFAAGEDLVEGLEEGYLRRHGFAGERERAAHVVARVVDPGFEARVLDGAVRGRLPVDDFVAGGGEGFDERVHGARDGRCGVDDTVCSEEAEGEFAAGLAARGVGYVFADEGFVVGTPWDFVDEGVEEPGLLGEDGLC